MMIIVMVLLEGSTIFIGFLAVFLFGRLSVAYKGQSYRTEFKPRLSNDVHQPTGDELVPGKEMWWSSMKS